MRGRRTLYKVAELCVCLMLLVGSGAYAQTLTNAFAHNDYEHKRPLFDAVDNGFANFEADIYLRDGKLLVAHILPMIKNKGTLEDLYFKPLVKCINGSGKQQAALTGPVTLMIDLKTNADKTYRALEPLLKKYSALLSSYENGKFLQRKVTIVLTGNKPYKILKAQQNRLAFIDEDLTKTYKDTTAANVYQTASCKYSKLLKWNGKGTMPSDQRQRLCAYVTMAHRYGKKVRLWASPESENVWTELLNCGVDLINTDQLPRLKRFLTARAELYANVSLENDNWP